MTSVINMARDILAVIQPMTGTRSAGIVTIRAVAGEEVVFGEGVYLTPIVSGKIRPDLTCKVCHNPAEKDGKWRVDDSGVDVAVQSNIGGARHNLSNGTAFMIDPDDPDASKIESIAANGAMSFGLDYPGFGGIKDAVIYENISGGISTALQRSEIKGFPAVILTWAESDPADSTTIATVRQSRGSGKTTVYSEKFQLSIIGSRCDSDHARRYEGMFIMDELSSLLTDRTKVDGVVFSAPGIQVVRRYRELLATQFYQQYYVYNLMLNAQHAIVRKEHRTFSDWNRSVIDGLAMQRPKVEGQGDLTVVDGVTVEMS